MELKRDIYLIGAGGHCKVIIEIIEKMGQTPAGIFDNDPSRKEALQYPVLDNFDLARLPYSTALIIAIGNNRIRRKVAGSLQMRFAKAIHPAANISSRATIKQGTVVMAGATVNSQALIGAHCILNTNCSVDHDCIIGDYVHISPGAVLAGNVRVGEGTHIGIGACVIQEIKIGRWATIGAGAVVIRDIPDYAVVIGNPARVIKYNSEMQ